MASLYGVNANNAFNSNPDVKIDVTDWNGKLRSLYDTFVVTAAPSSGDKIYMGKLPYGAKVKGARLVSPDLGSVGVLDVGYEYLDSSKGSAVTNAYFASVDVHTAAAQNTMNGTEAGYMFALLGEAYIVITATTAWDATSGTIKLQLDFIVE